MAVSCHWIFQAYACVMKHLMFTAVMKCLEHQAVVGELKVSSQKGSFWGIIKTCWVLPLCFSSCDSHWSAAPFTCPPSFPKPSWSARSKTVFPTFSPRFFPFKHLDDLRKSFYLLWKMGHFSRWWFGTRCSIKVNIFPDCFRRVKMISLSSEWNVLLKSGLYFKLPCAFADYFRDTIYLRPTGSLIPPREIEKLLLFPEVFLECLLSHRARSCRFGLGCGWGRFTLSTSLSVQ